MDVFVFIRRRGGGGGAGCGGGNVCWFDLFSSVRCYRCSPVVIFIHTVMQVPLVQPSG